MAHIGCQLWQVDETPTFDLLVNRSLAKSFWSWLTASAAEYGYEVSYNRELPPSDVDQCAGQGLGRNDSSELSSFSFS